MTEELTELETKMLAEMIRNAFDGCEWYEEDDIIGIARKMGFEELAGQMQADKSDELW